MADFEAILSQAGLGEILPGYRNKLTRALESEAGERGGELLARALCESIDSVMEAHGGTLTPEQSIALGKALAAQVVAELETLAGAVRFYADYQAAVVTAKTSPVPAGELQAARQARTAHAKEIKAGFSALIPQG